MSESGISDNLQETLGVFHAEQPGEPLTTSEVADHFDVSRWSIYDRLQKLAEMDRLRTKKVGAKESIWWCPPGDPESLVPESVSNLADHDVDGEGNSGPIPATAFLESVFDTQPHIVYIASIDGQLLWWNDQLESVTGYDGDELATITPIELIAESERDRIEHTVAKVSDRECVTVQAPLLDADGDTIPYELTVTSLTDAADEPVGVTVIGRDVSERRRTERELAWQRGELEHELSAVFERIDDAFFALDEEWRFSYVNEQAAAVLDEPVGELVGTTIWEAFPEAVDTAFQTHYERAVETQESVSFEAPYDPLDAWFEVTAYPSQSGLSVYFRDISDRKQREHRLEQYEQLVETVDDGIYALDADDRFTLVNDSFCTLTGYDRDELLGARAEMLYTDESRQAVRSMITENEPGALGHLELDIRTQSGEHVPCEARLARFRFGDGTVGRCGIVRDITDRKTRERDLARFRQAVDASGHAILMADLEGRVTYANSAFEELTGYTEEELLGETASVFRTGGDPPNQDSELWEAISAGRVWEDEIVDRRKDGTVYWAEQTVAPVTDAEGSVVEYVAVQKDITDRKQFTERLTDLNEASRKLLTADEETCVGGILVETVTDVFDLPACVVYSHHEPTGRLVPLDQAVETEFLDGSVAPVSATEGFLGSVFAEGSATYSNDVTELSSWQLAEDAPAMQAGTAVPLGDHGLLVVGSREPFEASTELLIGLLAANAEAAWDNVAAKLDLQRRIDQQETVTALGQRALEEPDMDALMAEAAAAVADVLDNEYCKVLELDEDGETLLLRQGVGWDDGIVGAARVSAREDDSQAAYTLETEQPVVVTDLTSEERFSGPSLLTDHDIRGGISAIIGSPDDPWGILGSHDTDPRQFSDHDANFVQSVANILAAAVERHADRRTKARQREELAALVGLSEVVRDIGDAVIDQSTRAEIEAVVCERLVASDSYDFAWFGRVDHPTQEVILTAEAGVENYLEDTEITVDPEDERSDGPTGRAFRTGEIQTWRESESDSQYEPWLEQAEEYGYCASAAIPITYQGTTYGVLNVYTERPAAFTGRERPVLEQLGAIVAHAIAAIERKRALMTDDVVELRFHVPDFLSGLDLEPVDGSISISDTVPIRDDRYVVYGTTTGDAAGWLDEIVDHLNHWEHIEYRDNGADEPGTFELHLDQPPIISTVASVGGSIVDAEIESGQYYLTIQTPPGAGVREIIDTVQSAYPQAEMLSRKQTTRDAGISRETVLDIGDELTDQQLAVLRAAYQAGFFEWPRDASGEDIAESLDIAAPTFHEHLRKAEKEVVSLFLSTTTS